mmetsp:Transcript_17365/g.36052  ORF Transcript_17365/g.36052 Transcript_17365/m.36052 type:complete len:137 (-) Transcript_17365:229-639(-)
MPNFCSARLGHLPITSDNEQKLKTRYEARNDKELPVLIRFFPSSSVEAPEAKYLDLILYSREQMVKEAAAMGRVHYNDAPWSLISIKAQDEPYELPMSPITVMRNELISQGGSGVPIDREQYMKAVRYWENHAMIK